MFKKIINKILLTITCCFILLQPTTVNAKVTYDVPSDNSFKAYMDYRTITSTGSKQYKLQELCSTNNIGLRMYDNRYVVAIGTGYNAPVGTYIDVGLDNGTTLHCVVGDIKQDCHTDPTNKYVLGNGNAIEFIVDSSCLIPEAKTSGSVGNVDKFKGDVVTITTYDSADEANGKTAVVTDKYYIELSADVTTYFVEYVKDGNIITSTIDENTYNQLTINESRITVE